jgi:hypothetical protein
MRLPPYAIYAPMQVASLVCESRRRVLPRPINEMAFVIVGRADWWVGVGSGPDATGSEFALAPLRGRIRLCPHERDCHVRPTGLGSDLGDIRRTCVCSLFDPVTRIGRNIC